MTSFLQLPRELRDDIYELCLVHLDEPAQNTPLERERRLELHDLDYFSHWKGNGIRWSPSTPKTSPSALLQVNRQIRAETQAAIDRLGLGPPQLDILLVDEDELWPTWTSVGPMRKQGPDMLKVTIRIDGISKGECSGFEEDADLRTLWRFSSILERFLRLGWHQPACPRADRKLFCQRLVLNFVSNPAVRTLAEDVHPHYAQGIRRQTETSDWLHPMALLLCLSNWVTTAVLHRNLGVSFLGSEMDLANLLGDRVGETRFLCDGRFTEQIVSHSETGSFMDLID